MLSYRVEVDHTDRSRHPDRTFVVTTHHVVVSAENDTEAALVASQMVAATKSPLDGMVTATRITDCVA